MGSTAHRPEQDQILRGQHGHVDPADGQRPPAALRAGLLDPDVEHCGVSERALGPVELLGLDAEVHHLALVDHCHT
ncbi:hypothetical protein NKG94_02480 [Micromonospora sp. M12]